jgi:alpha-L-fucosidase
MATNRRHFLKTSALSGLTLAIGGKSFADLYGRPDYKSSDKNIPVPTYPQLEWQDSELGLIFHFDISITAKNFNGDNDIRETFNPKDYNPRKLDTDQWLKAAKAAGATYATFVATHFCGFLQWQSDLYPYGLKQAAWKNGKGDIVADFVESCYKYNIRPGLYLSTNNNAYWQVHNHYVDWGKGKGTAKQMEFNRICEGMVEELCSRYGRLLQIWFDAGNKTPVEGGPDVLPIFEKYQRNGIFYSSTKRADFRWVGNELGFADYPCWATMPNAAKLSHTSPEWGKYLGTGDPNGTIWSPAMVDTPLRGTNGAHSWFWKPGQENGIYSLEQLMQIYEHSVGRNSNMVLGVVINPDGLVPEGDAQRLAEFGESLSKKYANPLGSAKGEGKNITINLKAPQPLNQYIVQEDIRFGERVRSYVVKGQLATDDWIILDKGSCIGHKRIASFSNPGKFKQIVLDITESTDVPFIREFMVL